MVREFTGFCIAVHASSSFIIISNNCNAVLGKEPYRSIKNEYLS